MVILPYNLSNSERIVFLRGYYDSTGYHPEGRIGMTQEDLLALPGFDTIDSFQEWYKTQPPESFEYECSGDCCRSLLRELRK